MKTKNISTLLLSVMLSSAAFTMTACNTEDTSKDTTSESSVEETSKDDVATDSNQKIDHNVDTKPESLDESDKILSTEGHGAKGALADDDMSIADMLMYAIQDEHLARGEYQAIIEKFGSQNPYSNILSAESTHISYLEEVYEAYEIDIPDDISADHIVVPGDLLEAAEVGVQTEIDNIAMYERFLSYELPENIEEVFIALRDGSKSHLLAFEKQVERLSR